MVTSLNEGGLTGMRGRQLKGLDIPKPLQALEEYSPVPQAAGRGGYILQRSRCAQGVGQTLGYPTCRVYPVVSAQPCGYTLKSQDR